MNIIRINHLGAIVADLDKAIDGFTRVLDLELDHIEKYGDELDIAFLPCGETLVELLKPLTGEGWNAEDLKRYGPVIQHVAFEVPDIDEALAEVKQKGVGTIGEAPRPGAQNTLIAFLDREPFGGILVELVQPATVREREHGTT